MQELRRAHRENPEALRALLRDYLKRGERALAPKPPGRKRAIHDDTLAMLLADVENAIEDGMSENRKIKELANGCRAGFDGRKWLNVSTIKTHLTAARKRRDTDRKFADRVAFLKECFRMLG